RSDLVAVQRKADRTGAGTADRAAARARGPRSPDPGDAEPAVERGEVQSPEDGPRAGIVEQERCATAGGRARQRPRHQRRRPGHHLRAVPAGRRHIDRQAAGNRAGPADQPAHHRAFRWTALGDECARRRGAVLVYTASRSHWIGRTPGGEDQRMTRRILIADDEPNIVVSLEFLMKREGFDVATAIDGEATLAAI